MTLFDLISVYDKVVMFGDSAECLLRGDKYIYWYNSETQSYEIVRRTNE